MSATPGASIYAMEERPPLGLRPRYVVVAERSSEIASAIRRYVDANEPVPLDWLDEMRELSEWLTRHHRQTALRA